MLEILVIILVSSTLYFINLDEIDLLNKEKENIHCAPIMKHFLKCSSLIIFELFMVVSL